MRIVLDPLDGGFTMLPNSTVRDPNLSLKSKGLLMLMTSNADGFGCTIQTMQKQCQDGRDAIKSGLKELRLAGYVKEGRERDSRGQIKTVLIVARVPRFLTGAADPPQRNPGKPEEMSENPSDGKSVRRTFRSTDLPAPREEKKAEENNAEQHTITPGTAAALNWPPGLSLEEKAVVVSELEKLQSEEQAEHQQQVLDLLAGQLAHGRKPSRLAGWVAALVRAAGTGQLALDASAKELARGRANRTAEAREQAKRREEAAAWAARTPEERARNRAAAEAAFAAVKAIADKTPVDD